MKTLYILRHAKSCWADASLSDFERPLNERGIKTAPFMGKLMAEKNFQPEIILSSPAVRAKQTAMMVKRAGKMKAEIRYDERIYEASPLRLVEIVSEMENIFESILLVGHNPGFEGLVRFLTGEFCIMPTAALAVLDLKIDDWSMLEPECCSLRAFIRPKEEMLDK